MKLLTIPESASAAGVTTRTIERAIASGRLPCMHRAFVRVLVSGEDLQTFIEQRNRRNAVAEPHQSDHAVIESVNPANEPEQPAAAPTGASL